METANERSGQRPGWELSFPAGHPLASLQAVWEGGAAMPAADPDGLMRRFRLLISLGARLRLTQASQPGACLEAGTLLLLSPDRMAAWLLLFPPVGGGAELTQAQLLRSLLDHGVAAGVDWALLRSIPGLEQRYFIPFPVARGTPPIPGPDGSVTDRVPRTLKGQVLRQGLGQANYTTLHLVRDIAAGDVICEIVPPGPGKPGCTVTGEELPAPLGRAAEVPAGRNTRLTGDGRFLVADCAGHVSFTGRSFQVKPVLHLEGEALTPASSINFLGDVHIHGDLPGGALVRATGSIQIDGTVENCSVEAGEHIIVSSGVQGQGQAVLHAQRQVYAKYLENCTVYALQDVLADCIINCDIYSNGTVQACTGRAVVIGGTVRAAREIRAGTVGSKAERSTRLELGGLPCEEAQREQLQAELDRIAGEIEAQQQTPAGPEREARLAKLRLNRCVTQAKLDKVRRELEGQFAGRQTAGTPCVVCGALYPGTLVTAGGESLSADRVRRDCAVGFSHGRLAFL